MSRNPLDKIEVLTFLCKILEEQSKIVEILENRLCGDCDQEEIPWDTLRETVSKYFRNLVKMYRFSENLPRNDLGIATQAAASYMHRTQSTLAYVLMMVDMVSGESFGEVYMTSLKSITSKIKNQYLALQKMTGECSNNPEGMAEGLQSVIRLEREIDEDNIIICRQITVATGGESDFICYMMRKIVRELEKISDYLKVYAEILAEI